MSKLRKLEEVTDEQWEEVHEWNRNIVNEFLEQAHLSPKTLKQYRSGLRQFFYWAKSNLMNKPLYEMKPKDALRWQNYLINRGLSANAVKFKRACVSSVCGYVEVFYGDEDYAQGFRNIYNKQIPNPPASLVREKEPLTKEEFDNLIKNLEEREEWQKIAYLKFSYSSGCRREEARQLLKEVVTYEKVKDKPYYLTHPIRCKGRGREGKVRRLVFDEEAMQAIKKWLEVRGEDDCEHVFVRKLKNGKTNQLGEGAFNYWCSDDFSEVVGRRVHPHLIRSSRATNIVVDEGKDIRTVQALLGHESSETSFIYVVRDISEDLDDAF